MTFVHVADQLCVCFFCYCVAWSRYNSGLYLLILYVLKFKVLILYIQWWLSVSQILWSEWSQQLYIADIIVFLVANLFSGYATSFSIIWLVIWLHIYLISFQSKLSWKKSKFEIDFLLHHQLQICFFSYILLSLTLCSTRELPCNGLVTTKNLQISLSQQTFFTISTILTPFPVLSLM